MADDHVFQRLCLEAVVACNGDIAAVERYVRDRVAALDDGQRDAVTRDLDRIFAFHAPDKTSTSH